MGDREDAVRARAYALWMKSGQPESAAMDFWLEAERQIEAERSELSPKPMTPPVEAGRQKGS